MMLSHCPSWALKSRGGKRGAIPDYGALLVNVLFHIHLMLNRVSALKDISAVAHLTTCYSVSSETNDLDELEIQVLTIQ